jgi:glucosylceramidase
MRERATAAIAVLVVAILLGVAGLVHQPPPAPEPSAPPAASPSPESPEPTPSPTPPAIEIWSTSMDRAFTTTAGRWVAGDTTQGDESESEGNAGEVDVADQTIQVDASQLHQSFNAVGAALTHSSAAVLAAMPADERTALLEELFAPDGPVRLGVLRIPLGGSDFVAEPAYTYDDLPAGETDWDLERFSTAADGVTLRPMLRQILAIAPDLQIVASPWSAPAWLKDSGRLDGGRLLDDDRAADTYAQYLARAVEEYAAEEIPIAAITVQNEPQARNPDGYPGMDMPVEDQAAVISALGPALRDAEIRDGGGGNAGVRTQILAYDHNWALNPADAESTPEGADPEYEYPSDVLRSAAAPWIAGIAYHCYSGDAGRMSQMHTAFPSTDLWVTECSGSHAPEDSPEQIFANTLSWQAQNLVIDSLNNWAGTVMTWNLALDDSGGPHIGGCDTCTGVVTIGPDGSVTRNAEYYALAAVGRFATHDAVVLSDDSAATLPHVALVNPDGSAVVVLFNGSDGQVDVALAAPDTGEFARATIPARALATVTISELPPTG